jgi:5-methylcytosine-specific restriction endonuclease McrA
MKKNQVFINGREISCKAGKGKAIAAFPDVCFTPPQTGATPLGVPIPYPNTALDKDTRKGSRRVKVSRKETMLKNKSFFKKSTGDEAGRAPKKGVITSQNKGKMYFGAWSMDVKIEGKNVVRHMDITTHNHASQPANPPPWTFTSGQEPWPNKKKPCDQKCPSEPSKARYKELRGRSPSGAQRRAMNPPGKKLCRACRKMVDSVSPDHIVPLRQISRMPGFACLSNKEQEKIANSQWNLEPLCTSCNTSKQDSLWYNWKGHKKKNYKIAPNIIALKSKATDHLLPLLWTAVKRRDCDNPPPGVTPK